MAKNKLSGILESLEPQERLRQLINYSNMLEVDPHVPPRRYYRSGLEMVRMANVYYDEGSLENAYCLYLKFMTLFLEKIRKHPDFNTVTANEKSLNQAKLREVLPKAEKLKEELLAIYKRDYEKYLADIEKLKKGEEEKRKKAAAADEKKLGAKPKVPPTSALKGSEPQFVTANLPNSIDSISYPDPNLPSGPAPSAPPASLDSPNDKNVYVPSMPVAPTVPSVDRTSKPSNNILEKFDQNKLRTVIVPSKAMVSFEKMAQPNTVRNVETCGILAGKLEKNELIITHVILPKQKGTSDSCATMNEEEIFDYQDLNNLITIGWIHTHPTQTAFLSSVDLHTHCPYQLLMPEAIAIVCSPKYNETGFFTLTPTYGLQFIANCRKTGFHPHPTEPPLFKSDYKGCYDDIKVYKNKGLESQAKCYTGVYNYFSSVVFLWGKHIPYTYVKHQHVDFPGSVVIHLIWDTLHEDDTQLRNTQNNREFPDRRFSILFCGCVLCLSG